MIFTCNFSNWKKIPVEVAPISIARFSPEGFKCQKYEPLFPPVDLIEAYKSNAINEQTYRKTYEIQVLKKLVKSSVVLDLYDMARAEGKDALVLLCYEASNKFCHRHIVRDWLSVASFACIEFEIKPHVRTSLGLRKKHD